MKTTRISDPETWLEQHGDYLYRFAMLRVRDRHVAEDLVQETFLAALHSGEGFSGQSAEKTWLVGILKHKIADHFRREAKIFAPGDRDPAPGADESFFTKEGRWVNGPVEWNADPAALYRQKEFMTVFERCLSGLSRRLAHAYMLREIEEMDHREMCKVLDVTDTNLWVMLHRARMHLRRCLETRWFGKEANKG